MVGINILVLVGAREMNDILVSVIIPVYNTEEFLERCLESIINQTYEKLQIILVNDGSTDGSRDVCLKYLAIDERIEYIEQNNQGLSGARNSGLKKASGGVLSLLTPMTGLI